MAVSQLKKNIAANFIARSIGFVMTYLFTPLFLKFLGIESFGLIGFFSTMMGILLITDVGLTASLTRETARLSVLDNSERDIKNIIKTYELIYIGLSFVICILVFISSSYIVSNWLNVKSLSTEQLELSIKIMGLAIAFQLPSGLYFGGLMGFQKQILANSIQLTWSVFKGFGTIIILWLVSPTIIAFAICQFVANLFYFVFLRYKLWSSIPVNNPLIKSKFVLKLFLVNWKYSLGIAGISLMSTIILQADKLIVSKILPLSTLGYYSLAGTLALLPIMIASPITSALFPKFISLIELKDNEQLISLYHRSCKLIAITIFPIGFTAMIFTKNILFAWTGSSIIASEGELVASILIFGQILQVITTVPFYFASAKGKTKLLLVVQILSVIIFISCLIYLVPKYGIIGASSSWLLMNLITLPGYMFFLHKFYLSGQFTKWFTEDVLLPIIVILPTILLLRYFLNDSENRLIIIIEIIMVWGISTLFALAAIPNLRKEAIIKYKSFVNKYLIIK